MSVAKYMISLEWKEFNVDLEAVEAWMRANAGSSYCGNQAGTKLELWFYEEPEQDNKDLIALYWEDLNEESDEVASYKSALEVASDKVAKKASGKAKLLALGLSEDEVAALLG